MDGKPPTSRCLICLCEQPDCPPPCGHTPTLLFHRHCLDKTHYVQAPHFRCPHCNETLPPQASSSACGGAVRWLLEAWLGQEGWWAQKPVYMCLKEAMLSHAEALDFTKAVAAEATRLLQSTLQTSATESDTLFRCRGRAPSSETAVFIRRTAFVHANGSIYADGFYVCAQRHRCSPRRGVRRCLCWPAS